MTCGKVISEDLRWAIVRMARTIDLDVLATYTGVSQRQIYRILAVYRATGKVTSGDLDSRRLGYRRHLTSDNIAYLHGVLNRNCDTYLDELKEGLEEICGVSVSPSTVWRTLRWTGYRMMKLTRYAMERSAEKHAAYIYRIGLHYEPRQLVFVDESSCDRRTSYRGRAWAIQGSRAVRKAFFIRGTRYSVLPALSLDGILHVNIVEGSFTQDLFADFIEGLLLKMNPFPGPNSVIVMDNCRIHKSDAVLNMIRDTGHRYEFLPPYSPDFNPIEPAFSTMKSHIRRSGVGYRAATEAEADRRAVLAQLHEAVWSVTPRKAEGWFRHCNYI